MRLDTDRWVAYDVWVAEECPEQPDEPAPLFRCDSPRNAAQVASVYNELSAEVRRLRMAAADALDWLESGCAQVAAQGLREALR